MEPLRKELHDLSHFLGALAHGAEKHLGRGCLSISFMAGKKFGLEAVKDIEPTPDPVEALKSLRKALADRGIVWVFEPFQGEHAELVQVENGVRKMRVVFRTCMVRNALFRFAHEQKLSLCQMAHGVFAGAMEKIFPGHKVGLEIIQAGPNACLKEMSWEEKA